MKKWLKAVAVVVLGLVSACTSRAQFPNNYRSTPTVSWNPSVGTIDPAKGKTPGTLQVTITFSGSTTGSQSMNNSGAHHTPTATVKVGNSTQSHQGPQFLPVQNMGWSYTFSFDLFSSGCTWAVLDAGGCKTDNQSIIVCSMMGVIGGLPLQKFQFEFADTVSRVLRNTRGVNGDGIVLYNAQPDCSNPPDFPGADVVFEGVDPIGNPVTDYFLTEGFGFRMIAVGLSFDGIPWTFLNVPRQEYTSYVNMYSVPVAPVACTNKDAGINP